MSGDQPDALDQLEARVDALEDRQKQLEQGAVDARGRKWTLSDFLSLGLTRRQAMGVLGSLAAGMTLSTALTQTVLAQPDGDPGVLGQETDRLDAWIDQMDANVVETEEATISTRAALPLSNPTDVTGSRSFDTTEENTTGQTLMVYVGIVGDGSSGNQQVNARLVVSSTSSFDNIDRVDYFRNDEGFASAWEVYLSGEVPPGHFYEVETGATNEGSIVRWAERVRDTS